MESTKRVLVIGDAMLDSYIMGTVERISPEAPVPILKVNPPQEQRLGGCLNVAFNLKKLGLEVDVMTLLGFDDSGCLCADLLAANGINLLTPPIKEKFMTTTKVRVMAGQHQIVRMDFEEPREKHERMAPMRDIKNEYDAIVVSDYAKGYLSYTLDFMQRMYQCPIFVDSKDTEIQKYYGAFVIKMNKKEFIAQCGSWSSHEQFTSKVYSLQQRLGCNLIITLGGDGIFLQKTSGGEFYIDSQPTQVYDVTGAGDVVLAVTAAMYLKFKDLHRAVSIANHAAGISVTRLGAVALTEEEILNDYSR